MKKSTYDTAVSIEKESGRYYIWIDQEPGDTVEGPNYRTKKHAEKAAKRLRKALGLE